MISDVLIALFFGGFCISFLIYILKRFGNNNKYSSTQTIIEDSNVNKEVKVKKSGKEWKRSAKTDAKFQFSHDWLVTVLKGQTGNILDFDISSSGRHIISVAADRSLFLWRIKEIWQKERKMVRTHVNLDHATKVKFSPDDKACIISLGIENILRVLKIKKETNTYSFTACADFPKSIHAEIINIGIASTGNFIMTCHSNTTLAIWSLKGDLLYTIDTGNMTNYFGIISPCARFVASTGFSTEARVWFVEFDKTKTFKQVTRAFELKGHNSGILELCFTHDSTKAATVSKDGTWRLWNINVDFKYQDPVLIKSGKYNYDGHSVKVFISLSISGACLCIAQNKDLYFIDTELGEIVETLQNVHTDPITALAYEPKNKIFLTSGGRHINVYNDIVTRYVEIRHLKEKLRKCGEDKLQKQKLINQVKESGSFLDRLLKNKI